MNEEAPSFTQSPPPHTHTYFCIGKKPQEEHGGSSTFHSLFMAGWSDVAVVVAAEGRAP